MVLLSLTRSYHFRFTKNMIRHAPMGSIRRLSDSGSGGTYSTAFIQYIDVIEPYIYELWCMGLYNISHKFYPTSQVEVASRTVGKFVTYYLSENGRKIQIIGKLSVNNSIQFLNIPNQSGGIVLSFICNLQACVEDTGWGSGNHYNQYWGGSMFDASSIMNVA